MLKLQQLARRWRPVVSLAKRCAVAKFAGSEWWSGDLRAVV